MHLGRKILVCLSLVSLQLAEKTNRRSRVRINFLIQNGQKALKNFWEVLRTIPLLSPASKAAPLSRLLTIGGPYRGPGEFSNLGLLHCLLPYGRNIPSELRKSYNAVDPRNRCLRGILKSAARIAGTQYQEQGERREECWKHCRCFCCKSGGSASSALSRHSCSRQSSQHFSGVRLQHSFLWAICFVTQESSQIIMAARPQNEPAPDPKRLRIYKSPSLTT